jgi:hypothetical protein
MIMVQQAVKSAILTVLLCAFSIVTVIPVIHAANGTFNDVEWAYGEVTQPATIVILFNNETFNFEGLGSHSNTYNYTNSYYDGLYWWEIETMCQTTSTYEYNMSETLSGNISVQLEYIADYVNIHSGDTMNFTWYGLKKSTMSYEYWILDLEYLSYMNTSNHYDYWETTYKKNATTGEILEITYDSWSDDCPYESTWNSTMPLNYAQYMSLDAVYSIPAQLSNLLFSGPGGTPMAWSNLLSEFYIFEDTNENGIFDVGSANTAGIGISLPSMMYSDEFRGMLMPYAVKANITIDFINTSSGESEMGYPMRVNQTIPDGINIDDLMANYSLQWNAPVETGEGDLEFSWAQDLADYPTLLLMMPSGPVDWNGLETDYQYANKLTITPDQQIKLETTNTFGEIANATLKSQMENLSLAVPYYTAFLAPDKIGNNATQGVPTQANDWSFHYGNSVIGKIDLDNPFKVNYTLKDYPTPGIDTVFKSKDSSVAKIIVDVGETGLGSVMSSTNPFGILLYGPENFYDLPPDYQMTLSYEVINYPTWNGHQIVHDPVFIANIGSASIPGFAYLLVLSAIPMIVLLNLLKDLRKRENNY